MFAPYRCHVVCTTGQLASADAKATVVSASCMCDSKLDTRIVRGGYCFHSRALSRPLAAEDCARGGCRSCASVPTTSEWCERQIGTLPKPQPLRHSTSTRISASASRCERIELHPRYERTTDSRRERWQAMVRNGPVRPAQQPSLRALD
jgi:hypothetical protein